MMAAFELAPAAGIFGPENPVMFRQMVTKLSKHETGFAVSKTRPVKSCRFREGFPPHRLPLNWLTLLEAQSLHKLENLKIGNALLQSHRSKFRSQLLKQGND